MINFRYNIKRKLGSGRSTVFLCEDTDFPGKDLAIKIQPKGVSAEEEKFLRDEYFILSKLNHPNIIKANEIGTIVRVEDNNNDIKPGCRFIIMEYFEGTDLLEYDIENENVLREILKQLCSVLYYLHQSNYIYYDLKPENILINTINGSPFIKLIDLGLAKLAYEQQSENARGTSEYIAPELLSKSSHDHQVDLYSLGILLYRLIYKRFPFIGLTELDIYKAHLAGEFEFPESSFSDQLIAVMKRLLAKDISERYYTSLQVLHDLDIKYDDVKRDWLPAKSFTDRKDVLAIIDSFFNRQSNGELVDLRGTEGAGKTSVLEKIFHLYPKVVYIRSSGYSSNAHFWEILLREIVFSDFIYNNLPDEVVNTALNLLEDEPKDLPDSLKSIIFKIVKDNKFILLLDEYNRYDELSLEIIKLLIPVFQVNSIKIILTEDSSFPYLANSISNLAVLNLSPFTELHLIEYIDKSFAEFFPKKDIMKMIMMYADLLPGSIDSFLRDIVLFGMLDFKPEGPVLLDDQDKLKLLSESQDSLYNLQIGILSKEELRAAQCLSLFETVISEEVLAACLNSDIETSSGLIKSLRKKNIVSPSNISIYPEFRSGGLKKYIYSKIRKRKEKHQAAAEAIFFKMPGFNRTELARQYEFAGIYQRSYEILKFELETLEKLSAYSSRKKVLQHLLGYPLNNEQIVEIKYILVQTLFKLSEKKYAADLIEELLFEPGSSEIQTELKILQGNCLISTGQPEAGIEILSEIISEIQTDQKKYEVLFDIASAQFDLNNYQGASDLCMKIIENQYAGAENKGNAYNLLALIEIQVKNNVDGAINFFEHALNLYTKAELKINIAGVELNLGNIYSMKADFDNAESHWDKALQINRSIGNLDQESKLLMNYGIYYNLKPDYEASLENYNRANNILSNLGDKNGEALILLNKGETLLSICSYHDAYEALERSRKIFNDLKNYNEEAEVLVRLAKYYFIIGSGQHLSEICEYFRKSIESYSLNEKQRNNLRLIECLILFNEEKYTRISDELNELWRYFLEIDETRSYLFTTSLLCQLYLNSGEINKCVGFLQTEVMDKICSRNILSNAERSYFFGKIAELKTIPGLRTSIEYYEEALAIIEEQSVTELTWKVFYAVAMFYTGRGMASKAEDYFNYLSSVYELISENIKDKYIRQVYFSKPERKLVIEQLKNRMQEQ